MDSQHVAVPVPGALDIVSPTWSGLARHTMMPPPLSSRCAHDPARATAELRLAALPDTVPAARRFAKDRLARWRLSRLAGDCELAVAELVTNSVKETGSLDTPTSYIELHDHTPAVIIVRLRLTATHVFAEVWDRSDTPPVRPAATGGDEHGRGLLLVEAFSTAWSWYLSAARPGKVVWACWELPEPSATGRPTMTPREPAPWGRSTSPWSPA